MLYKYISKYTLISISFIFLILFILMPLILVFKEAFSNGIKFYYESVTDTEALHALKLTLYIALISIFVNLIFGICAAWCICKFEFFGKNLIKTLIDLPLTISPVISGFIFVLIFGSQGPISGFLSKYEIHIIYAFPGMVIATLFVTLPFIVKELIPIMESQGSDEEEAAILLGASHLQVFFYNVLPKIKWALIYGILLSNARAMGEFGAVSVVSGHIRGLTNTIPLHVEALYNEYNFNAAFAVASILTILSLLTLIIKKLIEHTYIKNIENDNNIK